MMSMGLVVHLEAKTVITKAVKETKITPVDSKKSMLSSTIG